MQEAQDKPARPCGLARDLDHNHIDDPAVGPGKRERTAILNVFDEPAIGIVDVEPVGEERDENGILFNLPVVEEKRTGNAGDEEARKEIVQDVRNVRGPPP